MKWWKVSRWCVVLFCLATSAFANNDWVGPPTEVLANSERWRALLHWNTGTTLHSRNKSYVKDEQFFLSPRGSTDALAELEATLIALKPPGSPERCRFPARYRFLAEAFQQPLEGAFDHCDEYQEWREQVPDGRVVLVFPATYLNSPSSMFGHTLLRLDSKNEEEGVWLSWAVNFGAVVDDSEGSMLYIYRGLAGGYNGYFSMVPYHTKIQDYAHIENRDMWEYALALTEEERAWLIEHLWELKDVRFDYFFLDENCSLRLLELINLAHPGTHLLDGFRLTEIPVNTVRTVEQAGLIASRTDRPSKAVELQMAEKALSGAERRLAIKLAKDLTVAEQEAFASASSAAQQRIVNGAYQWLRFQQQGKTRDADSARRSMALLRMLNKYPKQAKIEPVVPERPEMGHATKMLALTGGERESMAYGQLEYRLTYHDWFDPPAGFLPGAHIEALQMKWRYQEQDKWRLQQLDVVDIRSLSPRSTFVKPMSWYVRGGLERTAVVEDYRLASYLEGGPGLAWQWGSVRPYLYAKGRIEHHGAHQQYVEPGAGLVAGALWHAPKQIVMGVRADSTYFLRDTVRHHIRFTANLPLNRQHALRLEVGHEAWRRHGDTEAQISWRYYFD